jgi:hypothetical protein
VQSHHGSQVRRLNGCQNRGASLSEKENEVVRPVKLYQKSETRSVEKQEIEAGTKTFTCVGETLFENVTLAARFDTFIYLPSIWSAPD